MNEKLHGYASNYIYVIPFALVVAFAYYKFEQSKQKQSKGNADGKGFLYRLLTFVALLTFTLVYTNKPLPGLEETINVSPADF